MVIDDERLRAITVGERRAHDGPILLAEYRAEWPLMFQLEAQRVRAVLGVRVVELEHVGSTSVPGLAAKPVIDIALAVADAADEPAYAASLEAAGYSLRIREPAWHEHRLFKGPAADINLHVFSRGCPEIDRMRIFRDWLRNHAVDRDLYERTKRDLARQTWKHVAHYADAKTEVVQHILARALAGK